MMRGRAGGRKARFSGRGPVAAAISAGININKDDGNLGGRYWRRHDRRGWFISLTAALVESVHQGRGR